MNSASITAVILARNEERNIARALDSLPPGTHVLVIDHGSTDATGDIAVRRGAKVIMRDFRGFVEGRRFALAQVQSKWTLMIDADEVLDARLREAIVRAEEDVNGYEMLRTTYYCGKALKMWSGERLLRLFKTDRAHLEPAPAAGGSAQLHEHWVVEPPLSTLDGALLHYSYPTHAAYRAKFDYYTSVEASGLASSIVQTSVAILGVLPRFFWYIFARGALRDGSSGVRVAWWSALYPAVVQLKARRTP